MNAARETTAVSFEELTQMVEKQLNRSYQPTIAARQKLLQGENVAARHRAAHQRPIQHDEGAAEAEQ